MGSAHWLRRRTRRWRAAAQPADGTTGRSAITARQMTNNALAYWRVKAAHEGDKVVRPSTSRWASLWLLQLSIVAGASGTAAAQTRADVPDLQRALSERDAEIR